MIKLGVVGLGHMGGYHASICTSLHTIQFTAVADINKTNLEKIKNKTVFKTTDYREIIPLVDAVIIALPTELHHPVAQDFLQAGKHVLLEKPLTKTLQEAYELFEIAQKKNVALHVGHIERFNGAVQELKKVINNPWFIESYRMGPYNERVAKDSVILDLMIHDLDIILNLVNSPVDDFFVLGNKFHSTNCDIANVQLKFRNGTIANIVSSRASQIKKRSMAIHQPEAFIALDFTTQDLSIHRRATASVHVGHDQLKYKQEAMVEHLFVYKDNPLKLEIEHFIRCIISQTMLTNPEDDIKALDLTFKIEKHLGIR